MHSAPHSGTGSRTLCVSVIFTVVLLLGNPQLAATARQPKPQPTVEANDLAKRIHVQINQQRNKHGLKTLAWDHALSRIAAQHSRDMANRNYLGHDTPDGKTFSDRYRKNNYSCAIRIGKAVYTGAENIALSRLYNKMSTHNGIADHDWNSVQEIALKTVEGWMNSAGHRENILTPFWRQEGIGVEIGPGNRIYITQNFC